MTMAKGGAKELDMFGMSPLFYATLSGDSKMSAMLTGQEDMHKKCDFGFSARCGCCSGRIVVLDF